MAALPARRSSAVVQSSCVALLDFADLTECSYDLSRCQWVY